MKLEELKRQARSGMAGGPLVPRRAVRVKDEMSADAKRDIETGRVKFPKRISVRGSMEESRAKIDRDPDFEEVEELEGFKPGEIVDLRSKTRIERVDISSLFEPRTDDETSKRKGSVVRPDIPRLDVRTLPVAGEMIRSSFDRSRAKLAADTGEVDE